MSLIGRKRKFISTADLWVTPQVLEGLRSESSVRNFAVEKLRNPMHYPFLLEEYGGKTKTDMVCDGEICIHIVGSSK
jgi:hypothetical protein